MRLSRCAVWVGLGILAAACPRPGPAPALDAGSTPDAGSAAPVDAGPPPSPPLALTAQATLPDGGTAELPMDASARPTVSPWVELTVAANLPLRNYRIRVFDDGDRVLPSDDQARDGADGTVYRLHLSEPLKPGRRYALLLDAQTGATFSDAAGRAHPDVRVEFQTSGAREKATPKRPKRRK